MKHSLLVSCLSLACAIAGSQELIKNGSFAENDAESQAIKEWVVPTPSQWQFANDDGIVQGDAVSACLRFVADGQPSKPATQKLTLKPGQSYTFRIAFKQNGCIPAAALIDADGKRIASLQGNKELTGVWKSASTEFKTAPTLSNPVTLELIGASIPVNEGTSCFDNISLLEGTLAKTGPAQAQNTFKPAGPNIALGKPYTFSLKPNYSYCTDPGDATQLTDGVLTEGYFWTQKSTVGWNKASLLSVTIDLGKEEPVCGVSWNTAAGRANVNWPQGLQVFIGNDKENWEYCGDLLELSAKNGLPPQDVYTTFRYATNDMKCKGRYLQFLLFSTHYAFVDEIEVYRGPDNWLYELNPEYAIKDPREFMKGKMSAGSALIRLKTDFGSFKELISTLPNEIRPKAESEYQTLSNLLKDYREFEKRNDGITIMPYTEMHERILALNCFILQAQGFQAPFLWHNERWDNLPLTTIPPKQKPARLDIHLMRGEVRGETVNITNPTPTPLTAIVKASGLPQGANLKFKEVLVTDTRQLTAIADALKPSDQDGLLEVRVPAGCTRQVWLSFDKPALKAGTYQADLTATIANLTLTAPLSLTVYDRDFPARPTMHVGGWDYVQGGNTYYKSPYNLKAKLAIMQELYVDSPWGTAAVMPKGAQFDNEGTLANENSLDFSAWDEWTALFPDARNYCVFWSVRTAFQNEKMGTPMFERKLGNYLNAWCRYIKKQGKNPKQLVILLYDEPHNHDQDTIIITWAKAIKATCTELTLFEDPTYKDPAKALPELYTCVDILCPNTPQRIAGGKSFRDFYVNHRKQGRTLWLYSCSGPARLLDPITYHRGQMWHAFDMGAVGTFYWALGCGGGIGNSFKAYSQTGTEYSPFFVTDTEAMHSKHSEAIREGVQDYEYMVMLRDRIASLRKQGKTAQADKAQTCLDASLAEVVEFICKEEMSWSKPKDRSVMDKARIAILQALVE